MEKLLFSVGKSSVKCAMCHSYVTWLAGCIYIYIAQYSYNYHINRTSCGIPLSLNVSESLVTAFI